MNYEKGTSLSGFRMSLILMLLSCGCADAMSKVFKVYGPAENEKQFLLYTFTVACLLSVGWMLWKKERLEKSAVFYGLLMGVPNFFSAKFLLMSLDQLPAMIVYPMFSVATVLVVTVVGIFVFRERLRSSQWVALVGILIALTLLNL
jgi:multidrug transporter EmrE-like cation transporter